MSPENREKVITGVITTVGAAIILGGLTLFWSTASSGGLVKLLGGVTAEDVTQLLDAQTQPALPGGLVIASQRRCADLGQGWRTYDSAAGRVIVGAGMETIFGYTRTFRFEEEGGYWDHTLTENEIPPDFHAISRQTVVSAPDENAFLARGRAPSMVNSQTDPPASGAPHNNMPPYIALYMCSRED